MRWSVSIQADGDRVLTREEIVELADAVAGYDGIASGIGTPRFGAQLVVEAVSREDAISEGTRKFLAAAAAAGLPSGEIVHSDAVSEADDEALEP